MKTHLIVSSFLALSLAACSSPINDLAELNPTDLETPDLLESEVVLSATPAPWTGLKNLVTDLSTPSYGDDITTDANNNVFAAVARNRSQVTTGLTPDFSLLKLDSGGNIVWTLKRGVGTPAFPDRLTVATDPAGNVYLAGNTGINLEGQRLNGQQDAFVTKYNTNGKLVWTRLIGAAADDGATGVGVDSSGEVYVSGWTCGTGQRLGGNVIRGACDMFVTKFSNGGARRWVQLIGTDGNELARTMSVAANGTVAVTGNTTAAFPGFSNPQAAETAFTAKLNSSGTIAWVKQFDGTTAKDVTIDSAGDIVTYGQSTAPILRKLRGSDGQSLWSNLRANNNVVRFSPNQVRVGPGNTLFVSYGYTVFGSFGASVIRVSPEGIDLPSAGAGGLIGSMTLRGNNVYIGGTTENNDCFPISVYPKNPCNTVARAAKYNLDLVQQ
jgi:hypothetical protein